MNKENKNKFITIIVAFVVLLIMLMIGIMVYTLSNEKKKPRKTIPETVNVEEIPYEKNPNIPTGNEKLPLEIKTNTKDNKATLRTEPKDDASISMEIVNGDIYKITEFKDGYGKVEDSNGQKLGWVKLDQTMIYKNPIEHVEIPADQMK